MNTIKIINVKPVPVSLSFCRGSRAEGSMSRARVPCRGSRVTFFFPKFFFLEKVIIDAINSCGDCSAEQVSVLLHMANSLERS